MARKREYDLLAGGHGSDSDLPLVRSTARWVRLAISRLLSHQSEMSENVILSLLEDNDISNLLSHPWRCSYDDAEAAVRRTEAILEAALVEIGVGQHQDRHDSER